MHKKRVPYITLLLAASMALVTVARAADQDYDKMSFPDIVRLALKGDPGAKTVLAACRT